MGRRKRNDGESKTCAIICGGIYAAIGFIIRIRVNNPFEMLHILGGSNYFPPLWVFNLLCICWMFLSGCAAGRLIRLVWSGRVCGREEVSAYSGGLFFIALFFLTLLWYPLFFGAGSIALCALISLLCVAASAMCALSWRRADFLCCIIMAANSVWLIYILLANLSVLLSA